MADPLSITASLLAVVGAGLSVAKKLSDLVDNWQDAPRQLESVGTQIKHTAMLLKWVLSCMEKHQSLFTQEFTLVLSDLDWRFKVIQKLVKKLIRSRDPYSIQAKFQWLLKRDRLSALVLKLDGLTSILQFIVSVMNVAESQTLGHKVDAAVDRIFARRNLYQTKEIAEQMWEHEIPEIPEADGSFRQLISYEEAPREMALWMSVALSAPTIPVQALPASEHQEGLHLVRQERRQLPFAPAQRTVPRLESSNREMVFRQSDIDTSALQRFNMPFRQRIQDNIPEVVSRKAQDTMFEPYEVNMVVSTNTVLRRVPSANKLRLENVLCMRLSANGVIDRLLREWTTLTPAQIEASASLDDDDLNAQLADDLSDNESNASTLKSFPDLSIFSEADDDKIESPNTSQGSDFRRSDARDAPASPAQPQAGAATNVGNGVPDQTGPDLPLPSPTPAVFGEANTNLPSAVPWPRAPTPPEPPRMPAQNAAVPNINRTSASNFPRPPDARPPRRARFRSPSPVPDDSGLRHRMEPLDDFLELPPVDEYDTFRSSVPTVPTVPSLSYGYPPPVDYSVRPILQPLMEGHGQQSWYNMNLPPPDPARPTTPKVADDLAAAEALQKELREVLNWTTRRHTSEAEDALPRQTKQEHEFRTALRDITEAELQSMVSRFEGHVQRSLQTEKHDDLRTDPAIHVQRSLGIEEHDDPRIDQAIHSQILDMLKKEQDEKAHREQLTTELNATRALSEETEGHLRSLGVHILTEIELLKKEVESAKKKPPLPAQVPTGKPEVMEAMKHLVGGATGELFISRVRLEQVPAYDVSQTPWSPEYDLAQGYSASESEESPPIVQSNFEGDETTTGSRLSTSSDSDMSELDDGPEISPVAVRSRPWKGPTQLQSLADTDILPLYMRGAKSSEVWYQGPDPILVREYAKDKTTKEDRKSASGRSLLISRAWVDPEALDRLGFRYMELSDSYLALDPAMDWPNLEFIVHLTMNLREMEVCKRINMQESPSLLPAPPSEEFFSKKLSREAGEERDSETSNATSDTRGGTSSNSLRSRRVTFACLCLSLLLTAFMGLVMG